jgi:hypothetical protein
MVTNEEEYLITQLGLLHGLFVQLPNQHADDQDDFRYMIHRLQDMVAARSSFRELNRVQEVT